MSTKKWKNKELNGLLNERWGFNMNLGKLNEEACGPYKKDDEVYEEGDSAYKKDDDKEMGDNPEGVTELMDTINGLSEKESEEIYKMLLKKHSKKK